MAHCRCSKIGLTLLPIQAHDDICQNTTTFELMFSRKSSIGERGSAMLILVVLLISHSALSYAAPAFFPIKGCSSLVPIDVAVIRVMPATEGLCCCADFAPPGYFDPPNTVVEAYTFVERFYGNGLDKASDALLKAYENSAKSNILINTGSLVHSYTVSVPPAPCSNDRLCLFC